MFPDFKFGIICPDESISNFKV